MQRNWFQIHLGTALVLMFTAGAFMLGNYLPHIKYGNVVPNNEVPGTTLHLCEIVQGWPTTLTRLHERYEGEGRFEAVHFFWRNVALNLGCLIWVLAIVAFFCESLIRRRKLRTR